jgi:hypothetical protein
MRQVINLNYLVRPNEGSRGIKIRLISQNKQNYANTTFFEIGILFLHVINGDVHWGLTEGNKAQFATCVPPAVPSETFALITLITHFLNQLSPFLDITNISLSTLLPSPEGWYYQLGSNYWL